MCRAGRYWAGFLPRPQSRKAERAQSLVPQGLDRIEPGGAAGREIAEHDPDQRRRSRTRSGRSSDRAGTAPARRPSPRPAEREPDADRRSARRRATAPPPRPGTAAALRARRAPMASRMPISRVRSVTETSMMFMMPMPPTSRLIAATAPSKAGQHGRRAGRSLHDLRHVADREVVLPRRARCCAARAADARCRACTLRGVGAVLGRDVDPRDVGVAGDAPLKGASGIDDDVVLVLAEARLALGLRARRSPRTKRCSTRMFWPIGSCAAEQLVAHGLADDADGAAGAHLAVDEGAACRRASSPARRSSRCRCPSRPCCGFLRRRPPSPTSGRSGPRHARRAAALRMASTRGR